MKKQAFNPYLPSWEYIPDGEPYVFGDRVYVYGSHDRFNGHVFCLGDYMGWSAPVDDLSDWRCEGVTYPRTADPANDSGYACLYAPDVTVGPDGRYYMYYVLDKLDVVSVAVCDSPAGRYQFYGYVRYKDGILLGKREGDEPQFDPGVITEDGKTWLYTGFCGPWDKTRHGAMCTRLAEDMVTVIEDPVFIAPGAAYAEGTGFEGHAFFEAPSIRKRGDTYYFVYSSQVMHELCYATSKKPNGDFRYGGVIVSNCDMNIDTYKPADMPTAYGGNNHGSIVEIKDQWYIFYHRQTNGHWYSRQGCIEPIRFDENGRIAQVEITSCGPNGAPLKGEGEYPAYIACNLFTPEKQSMAGHHFAGQPRVSQDGADGDKTPGIIKGIVSDTTIGFKYFDIEDVKKITVWTRCYGDGFFEVRNTWDGPVLAEIKIGFGNIWTPFSANVDFPKGRQALYLTYKGRGPIDLRSFVFEK